VRPSTASSHRTHGRGTGDGCAYGRGIERAGGALRRPVRVVALPHADHRLASVVCWDVRVRAVSPEVNRPARPLARCERGDTSPPGRWFVARGRVGRGRGSGVTPAGQHPPVPLGALPLDRIRAGAHVSTLDGPRSALEDVGRVVVEEWSTMIPNRPESGSNS
jgi:hypothetical protein